MPRTRTSKAKPEAASAPAVVIESEQLPPSDTEPAQLTILPRNLSKDARFVLLPNPATAKHCRYIYCSKSGVFELTRVSSTKQESQSCLLVEDDLADNSSDSPADSERKQNKIEDADPGFNGYVIEDASVLVATPFDPTFLLLPLFVLADDERQPNLAKTAEDHLETLGLQSKHMRDLLRHASFRRLLESHLAAVSEILDLGQDSLYRPDAGKLLQLLKEKAKSTVSKAWPSSLEAHVQKQLEAPVAIVHNVSSNAADAKENDPSLQFGESEAAAPQDEPPGKDAVHCVASTVSNETPHHVVATMRMRTVLEYMIASYVPPRLRNYFQGIIASDEFLEQAALRARLERIKNLRDEEKALRALSDNFSRKRAADDDDEAADIRAEKKRKKEEEEKRKKSESRALKDLKKTDTSGMKKLSSFFTKPVVKK